jgi:hypothetical protein
MKRIILILLCLPLFLFSQEERKYDRTISVSQFAKELKQAADKGIGYTLKDCHITYDIIRDKKHITGTPHSDPNSSIDFTGDMIIRDLVFEDRTKVIIENCKFGTEGTNKTGYDYFPTITFGNCHFGKLEIKYLKEQVYIKSSKLIDVLFCFNARIDIFECDIDKIKFENGWNDLTKDNVIMVGHSKIKFCYIWVKSVAMAVITYNTINTLDFGSGKSGIAEYYDHLQINDNTFTSSQIYGSPVVPGKTKNTLYIKDLKIKNFLLSNNTFIYEKVDADIILSHIEQVNLERSLENNSLQINSLDYNGEKVYTDSLSESEKNNFFRQYLKENKIHFNGHLEGNENQSSGWFKGNQITILNNDFDRFIANDNQAGYSVISGNKFNTEFNLKNFKIDSLFTFSNNTLPDYNRATLDKTILNNLGFKLNRKICQGNEDFSNIDSTNLKSYNQSINVLISQYRQFINILNQRGSELKSHFVMKLKDIQTNQKMFDYYKNPNMNTWFNWKGSLFLKWYSDYGMNPFKALTYCFWAMFYFALFYFFFYSDWDKIDRGFLIKRFNSVMDYFTTEKRIEDFYSSTHDKEMTTFTEFKETLDKNKVYMPAMLASLAKPIYQLSLLRYKLLNFSYKKAEFMAGRKWVDLEKKDRYWIGTLTFFLTLTYIIYLVLIRALNSMVLSINAFSTLGFGQIPVRGFTKYVAIIEGFIGWFMLSVFIVSLLSQMMSV